MAGYSWTPLTRKLGIEPGHEVLLLRGIPGLEEALAPLPEKASVRRRARRWKEYEVILAFCETDRDLDLALARGVEHLGRDGFLWLCWPGTRSGNAAAPSEWDVLRAGRREGLVDVETRALTDGWTGARFVAPDRARRAENRAGS